VFHGENGERLVDLHALRPLLNIPPGSAGDNDFILAVG
jgi:hypothetical protein